MEVSSFTLKQTEIGTKSIQPILKLDDAKLYFSLLVFELLKLIEGSSKFLFFCFYAFCQPGFNVSRLLYNLLHAYNLFAQDGVLLMGQAKLLRIICLRVAAAQRSSACCAEAYTGNG